MGEGHSHGRRRRRDLLGAEFALLAQEIPSPLDPSAVDEVTDDRDIISLLADPRLADRVPIERIPTAISQLSAIIVRLAARQMQIQCEAHTKPAASGLRDSSRRQWLTIEEASSEYPLSKSWLYRNAMKLGFAKKMGAKVLVSVQLLERYLTEGRNR
jgi:hypothetical protein